MAKREFWNGLAEQLRDVTDYQLDQERWDAISMMGKGTAVALLGGIGLGAGLLVNSVLEANAGDSLPAKIVKNLSRGIVGGGAAVTAAGIWFRAESWRASGLVVHESRRRAGYLRALSQDIRDQALKKSVREDGRGPYFVAKDILGGSY